MPLVYSSTENSKDSKAIKITEPSKACETSSVSNSYQIELLPKEADLTESPDVMIEPENPPYNLGGWLGDNTVSWVVNIPVFDNYKIILNYSRPGEYPDEMGVINIEKSDGEKAEIKFVVRNTGDSSMLNDWSQYIEDQAT